MSNDKNDLCKQFFFLSKKEKKSQTEGARHPPHSNSMDLWTRETSVVCGDKTCFHMAISLDVWCFGL